MRSESHIPMTTRVSENDDPDAQWKRAWARRIMEAQRDRVRVIAGRQRARIPYGREGGGWDALIPCHDCAVTRGQLHVPGCDVERCPACRRQRITCGCEPRED